MPLEMHFWEGGDAITRPYNAFLGVDDAITHP